MRLSARNMFKGKIIEINEGAVNGIVKIDAGCGHIFSATISLDAINELGLVIGQDAQAVIKATDVIVAVE